jgi:signal transduction histidine kinase
MSSIQPPSAGSSVFDAIRLPREQQVFVGHRHSLLKISEAIEDIVLANRLPARVFAGFQKLSFFLPVYERFAELALHAESVWIFGVPDVVPPENPHLHYVLLEENHPLVNEWFLVVGADGYRNALIARDLSGFQVSQQRRRFQGTWLFDAELVDQLLDWFGAIVGIAPLALSLDSAALRTQMSYLAGVATRLIGSLEQRNIALYEQQDKRREIVNMIVHDLRNPLSALSGYVDLIDHFSDRPPETGFLREFAAEMQASVQDLEDLIEDILDLNRMQNGQLPVSVDEVFMFPLLESLRERYRVVAEKRQLYIHIEPNTETIAACADERLLQRVLANLISNAIRHTTEGGITLNVYQNAGYVRIEVGDTGEGIDAEELPFIFDLYYQGREGKQRPHGVAGLGLAFSKQATEAQGGQIAVRSEPGQGTLFTIDLPATL